MRTKSVRKKGEMSSKEELRTKLVRYKKVMSFIKDKTKETNKTTSIKPAIRIIIMKQTTFQPHQRTKNVNNPQLYQQPILQILPYMIWPSLSYTKVV